MIYFPRTLVVIASLAYGADVDACWRPFARVRQQCVYYSQPTCYNNTLAPVCAAPATCASGFSQTAAASTSSKLSDAVNNMESVKIGQVTIMRLSDGTTLATTASSSDELKLVLTQLNNVLGTLSGEVGKNTDKVGETNTKLQQLSETLKAKEQSVEGKK